MTFLSPLCGFKMKAQLLCLMSVNSQVFAEVNEQPWQDKVYTDFLTWNSEIQRYPDCDNCSGVDKNSPVQKFYFMGGGKIEALNGSNGDAVYLSSGVDFTSYIGEAKSLTLIGRNQSLVVNQNSSATFNGTKSNIDFGASEWDEDGDAATVYLDQGAKLNVDMGTMHVSGGAETNLKLFDNATANIKLSGDFVSEAGGTGVAIENDYGTSNTNIAISAENIKLSTVDDEKAKRKSGLYLLAYDGSAGQSNLSVKFSAKSKLEISGFRNGIKTFGTSRISLNAKDVEVNGNSYGINLYGYGATIASGETVTSGAEVNSDNSVLIKSENTAAYLRDRSSLSINSEKSSALSGDYIVARVEGNSQLTVVSKEVDFTSEKTSNWAFFVVDHSYAKIDAETTNFLGKTIFKNGSALEVSANNGNSNGMIGAYGGSTVDYEYKNEFLASVDNDPENLLMYSNGTGSQVRINAKNLNIRGYLEAGDAGKIDVLSGINSQMLGATILDDSSSQINLTFDRSSTWKLTDNSELTSLKMNASTIDFSGWKPDAGTLRTEEIYRSLKTSSWSGENNTLKMKIDLAREDSSHVLTDQFVIQNEAKGSHIADIKIDGRELVPEKLHSINWLVSQGANSKMTIKNKDGSNQFSGNGMVTTWALSFVGEGEEGKLDNAEGLTELAGVTTGVGSGKWYLVRSDAIIPVMPTPTPTPNPVPDPSDPSEMQQITNLGVSATQALSFASELEDLRTRLGEIRYGAQDGAWVRAGFAKERANGYQGRGFKQKTNDLHIGLDRLVGATENSSWLVGGALRYAKSKQDGFTAARGGEGELEQYSAKLYATYMRAQGLYADFVLQAGRYSQELTGLANDLSSAFTANYRTYGYGASVEVGHMFDFNNKTDDRRWFNHSFVEPQIQLSYFYAHGKDYETSTGMTVSQGNADFLTGRAGLVIGQKFNFGTQNSLDRRYLQFGLKGGMKYEFLGDQMIRYTGVEGVTKERQADDVKGARYYYGVTGDWQLGENFRAYASIEREEGDHYTKDFDVSVGLKYQFN